MDQISLTEVIVFSVHPYSNFWLNFIDKEKRQANTLEHIFYISLLIDQEMKQNRKLDRKVNNQKEQTEKLGLNSFTSLFYITVPRQHASYFFLTLDILLVTEIQTEFSVFILGRTVFQHLPP